MADLLKIGNIGKSKLYKWSSSRMPSLISARMLSRSIGTAAASSGQRCILLKHLIFRSRRSILAPTSALGVALRARRFLRPQFTLCRASRVLLHILALTRRVGTNLELAFLRARVRAKTLKHAQCSRVRAARDVHAVSRLSAPTQCLDLSCDLKRR